MLLSERLTILLELLKAVHDLKLLPRTGWLFAGVRQPESVAEHSYATCWLALLLAEEINTQWQQVGLDAPLNVNRVVLIALVHDLAESLVTDLPKRTTLLIGKTTKHAAEAAAMQILLQKLPNGEQYIAHWQEYVEAASPEGRLVRDVDKLEMVYQALRYEESGQRNLDDFWHDHQWFYAASQALFDTLQALRIIGP